MGFYPRRLWLRLEAAGVREGAALPRAAFIPVWRLMAPHHPPSPQDRVPGFGYDQVAPILNGSGLNGIEQLVADQSRHAKQG